MTWFTSARHYWRQLLSRAAEPEPSYVGDAMRVWWRNTEFLREPRFLEAYQAGLNSGHKFPDQAIGKWRVHVVCWAAYHAAQLPGDLVECGVNTGVTALAAAHYMDLNATGKHFFLFDTYEGIPDEQISARERALGRVEHNAEYYQDCYVVAQRNLAPFPNAHLIRGRVPETLASVPIDRVCYLSLDMNIAYPERAAIEYFWDKLSPGALVLMDDYGWQPYAEQKETLDEFATQVGCKILTLPTGQGLLLKP